MRGSLQNADLQHYTQMSYITYAREDKSLQENIKMITNINGFDCLLIKGKFNGTDVTKATKEGFLCVNLHL